MSEFLHMGGYAAFVWPAYLAVLLVAGLLGGHSWRRQKSLAEEAARLKSAIDGASSANDGEDT